MLLAGVLLTVLLGAVGIVFVRWCHGVDILFRDLHEDDRRDRLP